MRRNNIRGKGLCALAFAVGIIASCLLPLKFLVAILAIWIIILAITGCNR